MHTIDFDSLINHLQFQVSQLSQTVWLLPNCPPPPWTPRPLTIIISDYLFLLQNNSLHHHQPLLKGHLALALIKVQDSPMVSRGWVLMVQITIMQVMLLLAISNTSRHKMFKHFSQKRRDFMSSYSARQYPVVSLVLFF